MKILIHYLDLTLFFGKLHLNKLIEYRSDFIMGVAGFLLDSTMSVATVFFLFNFVPQIQGWSLYQILFIFGFSLIPKGIDYLFTDYTWELSRRLIQRGEFSKYLTRPINPLFYMLSERFFHPDGIGGIISGIVLLFLSATHLNLTADPLRWIVFLSLIPFCMFIYFSIKLIFASIAFWTTVSMPSLSAVMSLADFVKYPLDIYSHAMRFLLTWIIPFAFTAYFPTLFLFTGEWYYPMMTVVISISTTALAFFIWNKGVENFESTGT